LNDPGTPPLDWDSLFDRAHRRIAVRLILLATIGALGAILLLGGGLKARGKLSLGFGRTAKKTKVVTQPPPRNPPPPVHHREERTSEPTRRRQPVKPPPQEPEVPIVAPPVCVEEEDASGKQYCHHLPSGNGGVTAADGGNGGTIAEGEPEPTEPLPSEQPPIKEQHIEAGSKAPAPEPAPKDYVHLAAADAT
jgi:hypothetical protein